MFQELFKEEILQIPHRSFYFSMLFVHVLILHLNTDSGSSCLRSCGISSHILHAREGRFSIPVSTGLLFSLSSVVLLGTLNSFLKNLKIPASSSRDILFLTWMNVAVFLRSISIVTF